MLFVFHILSIFVCALVLPFIERNVEQSDGSVYIFCEISLNSQTFENMSFKSYFMNQAGCADQPQRPQIGLLL